MNRMRIHVQTNWSYLSRVILLCAVVLRSIQGCFAQGGAVPTVSVLMKYDNVLMNEQPAFTITFSNATASALPIIRDAEAASGKLLFVDVQDANTGAAAWSRSPGNPHRMSYVETDGIWSNVLAHAATTLPPGDFIVWRGRDLGGSVFNCWGPSAQSMRVHVMYGSNTWVSSAVIPIRVIQQDVDDLPTFMTNTYYVGPQNVPQKAVLHKGTIDGREAIFDEGRLRLFEVPPGVAQQYEWNATTEVLRISFPDSTNPAIIYNQKQWDVTSE